MFRAGLIVLVVGCGSSSSSNDVAPIDAPTDAPTDAGPCGMRSGMRGKTSREVTIDGKKRTYIVYLPDTVDAATPIPLVLVYHGFTMSGQLMFDITKYPALADSEHIALAFPDGQGGANTSNPPWNVGMDVCPSYFGAPPVAMGDDFKLLDAMRADIAQDQCVDPKHVFVTGFSMGGYFSHHAGCMRKDIAAIAPASGGTHVLDNCASTKKPVIIFHGTSDSVIPTGCNDPNSPAVQNVVPAATAWATHNGCDLTTHDVPVTNGTCRVYDNCPPNGQVEICTFNAMGHCWAGGAASQGVYSCPTYADATAIEWQFFKDHAW